MSNLTEDSKAIFILYIGIFPVFGVDTQWSVKELQIWL